MSTRHTTRPSARGVLRPAGPLPAAGLIGQTKSRVVLSYNDCPFIRDLYRDFWVVAVRRNNPMANRYTPGSEYGELVILNYDPRDHPKDRQMTLFQADEPLLELEYTLVCEGGKTNEESEKTKRPASPQPFSEGHGTGPGAGACWAALFPGVILLTRRFPSPQEREEIGESLSCVARDLDLPWEQTAL